MSEIVSFKRYRQPSLPFELMDAAATVLHVQVPSVDLLEEFLSTQGDLMALLDRAETDQDVQALFDLVARLMSVNLELKRVTGRELQDVYMLQPADLVVFFTKYAEFLTNIKQAKN